MTIQSKADLPLDLASELGRRFSSFTDHQYAINSTMWKDEYIEKGQFVFAHLSPTVVFLVNYPEARTIKIHIEDRYRKRRLSSLRRHIEEVGLQMENFLKHHDNSVTDLKIVVSEDWDEIQTGVRLSWLGRYKRILADQQVYTWLYVPAVTLIWSHMLNLELDQSLLNALGGLGAIFLWAVGAAFTAKPYNFTDTEGQK